MTPFIWNRCWHHAGASLWCLAVKIADASLIPAREILSWLVAASNENRMAVWFPSEEGRLRVERALELDAADTAALFIATGEVAAERQHVALALRWCPECAVSRYHSAKFQDRRVRRCPWHGARLRETCDQCGRAVDPLGKAWTCGYCGRQLSAQLTDWLNDFKVAPDHDGHWPASLPREFSAYEQIEGGMLCLPDPAGFSELRAHYRAQEYWDHAQLFESASALWDSVLADHRECAAFEMHGYSPFLFEPTFECPVAAAAISVFGQMQLQGARAGDWPKLPAVPLLEWQLKASAPFTLEVRKAFLRELPRAWLADALLQFGEVARQGRFRADWWPSKTAFNPHIVVDSGSVHDAHFLKMTTDLWLKSAVGFASVKCKRKPASDTLTLSALLKAR
jgi:hypothetical protein